MKPRLFACIAVSMLVVVASVLSAGMALARGGPAGQDPKSEEDRGRSEGHFADVDKALRAFDERTHKNLEKCREELGQLKKDLHELIDMRISMALALAELRAKNPMPGEGEGVFAYRKDGGQRLREREDGSPDHSGLAREFQQVHSQLRAEIEQQQNQVAQLAAQLRALKGQGEQGQHAGARLEGRKDQPVQNQRGREDLPQKK
jgi:hypothetical protein